MIPPRGRLAGLPDRVLAGLLALLLTATLLLIVLQIVLRTVFSGGLTWIDPLVRHLVVWTGFAGAVLAAGRSRHITIDLLSHFLPPRLQCLVNRLNHLFAAAVCGLLAHAAFSFLRDEMTAASAARLAGIPAAAFLFIYPAAFGLLTLRFLVRAFARQASGGASCADLSAERQPE